MQTQIAQPNKTLPPVPGLGMRFNILTQTMPLNQLKIIKLS